MSKTVDDRVVEMRFDNKQFESNVQTSLSTLDKLKQSLRLTEASKGLENVSNAAKKFDLSALGNGVETVKAKFSALEVMAVTTLANITNSAVNAGKSLVSAFTIDPIKTGLQEYETQINAVQTILANTQSKGTTLDQVNEALDELNHYADMTIYNFTEMTRNIGTFTAAGVDLDTSVSAIKGIANLAAVSGSTSQQASTAMYQLSQALASGTVKLMDWNSVVNAGMGGQVFQDALKETARVHGIAVDQMIKDNGSFRETLQEGWLTSEILTETLSKFTGDLTEEQIKSMGYTEEQAKEIMKLGKTANDAATKVKTFTQLMDTLKEAAQSGWTQSWEIIVGDFEEAKTLWTSVSDTLSEMINESANARNEVLQGWADKGGREMAIESIKNAFEGLRSIIKPVKEAFREVFPAMTADRLVKITKNIRDLTKHFKLSESQSGKLKSTFKGLFSVIDIGVTFLKEFSGGVIKLVGNFKGLGGEVLDATGSFGDWLSNLRDSVKETDIFGKSIDKVVGFVTKAVKRIKDFGSSINKNFKGPNFDSFVKFMKSLAGISKTIGTGTVKALSSVGSAIAKLFGESNFFDIINNGLLTGILLYIGKFVKGLAGAFDEGVGVLENVKGILDDVRGCFQAYQDQLKAGTLLKIATAIGILAASIFVISTINTDDLGNALGAITVLFVELIAAMGVFNKLGIELKGTTSAIVMMIGMSTAVLILATSMKKLSGIDWEGIIKGLVGVAGLVGILVTAAKIMNGESKTITKFAGQMVIMSVAIGALTLVAKALGSMSWEEIFKGGTGILGIVTILVTAAKVMDSESRSITKFGGQMIKMSIAIGVLTLVAKALGSMSWEEIAKAGTGILGFTTILVAAAKIMDSGGQSITKFGGQMLLMAASLAILTPILKSLGSMSWEEVGKGLTVIGVALAEFAIGLNFMSGTLSGSAALIIAATAIAILTPSLKALGSMSIGEIAKSLITLAAAFAVIGVAGYLLAPVIPAILGLTAAFALFGVSMLGIGAGLTLIGVGLTAIAAAGTVAATSLVASFTIIITGILDLIPTITKKIGDAIIAFAQVIGDCAPEIADALLKLLSSVLVSMSEYVPQMVDSLLILFIKVINELADHMPELIKAFMNLVGAFFKGVIDALNGIDTENMFKAIIAVGLLTALTFALSAVAGAIPGAMIGVLGLGAVITELALVLTSIGALAQLPGLEWLIGEGGNLLEKIGKAIGQFVGGIAGGIAEGFTSSLPEIASDLSTFMKNIKPFIEGSKNIDDSTMKGVESLSKAIILLTAADFVNGIASWFTGGTSIADFAEQLVPFGEAMKKYSESVKDIDSKAVSSSASAGKALAELATNLPNSGGVAGFFAGENDMANFAEQLVPFGKAIKKYGEAVYGLDSKAVSSSASAGKALAELAMNLPNSGGVAGFFVGENDMDDFAKKIIPFGEAMKGYADSVIGMDAEAVVSSVDAVKALVEAAKSIQGGELLNIFTGEDDVSSFGTKLIPFGNELKKYSDSVAGISVENVSNSASAAKSLAKMASSIQGGGLFSLFTGDGNSALFGDKLTSFGKNLKQYSVEVSGMDTSSIYNATSAFKSLLSLAKEASGVNFGGMNSFGVSLKKLGKASINDFVKAFSSSGTKLNNAGNTMITNLSKGINSGKAQVTKVTQTVIQDTIKSIQSKQNIFSNEGRVSASKFAEGIKYGASAITVAFSGVLSLVASSVRSYYGSFHSAGSYLGDGLVAGIKSKKTAVYNAGKDMGATAAKGSKDGAKEHSPSKLTIQQGKYLGEGLIIGIKDTTKLVYKAGKNMGEYAVDSISSAISRVADTINNGIDTQPTIRPVLDLSDVSNGAATLNGLLAMNSSVGFTSNVRAISSMMNRRQNGNSDVISAIKDLGRKISDVPSGDSYTINGITYDDGTGVADAVKTLVRAARVERRM